MLPPGTRCQILRLKCTKFDFRWGSAPDPAGGAYSTPPDPLTGFGGPTSKGRGGEEREGRGRGKGRETKGRGEEGGEGRGGRGLKPPQSKFSGYVAGKATRNASRLLKSEAGDGHFAARAASVVTPGDARPPRLK